MKPAGDRIIGRVDRASLRRAMRLAGITCVTCTPFTNRFVDVGVIAVQELDLELPAVPLAETTIRLIRCANPRCNRVFNPFTRAWEEPPARGEL